MAMSGDEVRISVIDGVAVYRWFDGAGYAMSFGYAETTARPSKMFYALRFVVSSCTASQCRWMRCVYR